MTGIVKFLAAWCHNYI